MHQTTLYNPPASSFSIELHNSTWKNKTGHAAKNSTGLDEPDMQSIFNIEKEVSRRTVCKDLNAKQQMISLWMNMTLW